METWEVILILGLVTISLMVLLNHNIAPSFISLLDNPMFQLTIVGLTLGVAGLSPPVAIVGIATIVIVYYVRNLNKVQLINKVEQPIVRQVEQPNVQEIAQPNVQEIEQANVRQIEPRLLIEKVNTQYLKIQEIGESNINVKQNNLDNNNMVNSAMHQETVAKNTMVDNAEANNTSCQTNVNTRHEDKDVLERALNEHKENVTEVTNYKNPVPVLAIKPKLQDTYPNPKTEFEGFQVDSADPKLEIYGSAPKSSLSNFIMDDKNGFSVDSNVYTKGESVPIEYNEFTAQPTSRPYHKSEGQYIINENRPYQSAQKYEVADFTPGTDMGENVFTMFGNSIDDKITNLKKGIQISKTAPPNFDVVEPSMPKSI
jgi:hypothetical protein